MVVLTTKTPAMAFFNVSSSVAKMVHRGIHAHIGAHGEPPLGLMYHHEMALAKVGGLSNYEVGNTLCRIFRPKN